MTGDELRVLERPAQLAGCELSRIWSSCSCGTWQDQRGLPLLEHACWNCGIDERVGA